MKKILGILSILSFVLTAGCSMGVNPFEGVEADVYLPQLETPQGGAQLAVITTSMGVIEIVLYPEYAPNAVDNFISMVNSEFYNNNLIYAVNPDAFFMTGANQDDFNAGSTMDGKLIPNEISPNLWPFKGAVMSFSHQNGYGDSRFFICNDYELSDSDIKIMEEYKAPPKLIDAFKEKGGIPGLSGGYTVFGQVVNGFDALEKIVSVEVDAETYEPVEKITVEKVELTEYNE